MNSSDAACPAWLAHHLQQAGGVVPFSCFMDWALNDPGHGYYGSGQALIGVEGDFVTSPSLGPDFAALLAVQLGQWLGRVMAESPPGAPLSLVECGPGSGQLALDLVRELLVLHPDLAGQLDLRLIELNPGMRARQQSMLEGALPIPVQWCSLHDLKRAPVRGVVLAHELLDALPVERLVWSGGELSRQGVKLQESADGAPSLTCVSMPLPDDLRAEALGMAEACGFNLPPLDVADGWTTEWHGEAFRCIDQMASGLCHGVALVIDYALEARRYYAARREQGTLMAYQRQQAAADPLSRAGQQDLTAHLCIDTLQAAARQSGLIPLPVMRQGEALLALGLAERLHGLQQLAPADIPQALQRREALLRLVDPVCLGEFRWLSFLQTGMDEATDGWEIAVAPGDLIPV